MSAEKILYILSAVFFVIMAISAIYLFKVTKINKKYKTIIDEDTTTLTLLNSTIIEKSKMVEEETVVLDLEEETAILSEVFESDDSIEPMDIDISALRGNYKLLSEIKGGGMSRIFIAENVKLGNKWIVKYISNRVGALTQEENVLKLLNHVNLPKIIDIFYGKDGIFIVESYIEGVGLDKLINPELKVGQSMFIEWADQLGKLLNYLHNLQPEGIVHADLKPSNIMVTHDDKLVLIDFGISKVGAGSQNSVAATYKYAAPEQLKKVDFSSSSAKIVADRFGTLPSECKDWQIDNRTDIFSLGVILHEVATGRIPLVGEEDILNDYVSKEIAEVIQKCIQINPEDRYQDISEFLADIERLKNTKISMVKSMMWQKIAVAVLIVGMISTGSCFASATYITNQENMALVAVAPNSVCISEQQKAELIIQKQMPNGKIKDIDISDVEWDINDDNIAKIDGNMIVGINEGTTEIFGKYRNKIISVVVTVVKPVEGMVEVSLGHGEEGTVETYAGNGERDLVDGTLKDASFVSPERMAEDSAGRIYVCDSGELRVIEDGEVSTIEFEPDFLTVSNLKCFDEEVFILTDPWEDIDGNYYGIIRLTEDAAEGWYIADAVYTKITDFDFDEDGNLYVIEYNYGEGNVYLKKIYRETLDIEVVALLEPGAEAITYAGDGMFYYSNVENGTIKVVDSKTAEITYFVGVEDERNFVDGKISEFYQPMRLKLVGDYLYVLDFDVVRRIHLDGGTPVWTDTVAGVVTTEDHVGVKEGAISEVSFDRSMLMDFLFTDDGLLISNPKNSVIQKVSFE